MYKRETQSDLPRQANFTLHASSRADADRPRDNLMTHIFPMKTYRDIQQEARPRHSIPRLAAALLEYFFCPFSLREISRARFGSALSRAWPRNPREEPGGEPDFVVRGSESDLSALLNSNTPAGNYHTGVTHVYITDDDLASRKTRSRVRRRGRDGTGGENQARDTSNSFINGLSQRECLRARFSLLLGNRKIHQPDASSPPGVFWVKYFWSPREYALP